MEPWEDPDADNETLIMGALFEIKARLIEVEEHVVAIGHFSRTRTRMKKRKKTALSPEIYDRHERLQNALRRRLELLAKRDAERRRQA